MTQEEVLQKAMMLKQQSEQVEQQLNFVLEQIDELGNFNENLEVLEKDGESEMLANLGRGVYVKADRKENENLFVEVGAGVVVRKTPSEAREVISGQIRKFNEAKIQLVEQLESFKMEFGKMIGEIEGLKKE